ncbi:uncharacterized protein [Procambarus clarkii]|uniref:uncharacterized protein n=1 Tax=Procambarus clarkii TaxID=6728 RepID=UPI003743F04F
MGAVQVYQTVGSGRCGEPYHALTTPTEVSCALHCGKSETCTGFQTSTNSEVTGQSGVTCELLHTLTSPDLSTNFACYAQVPSSTSTAIPTISGSLTTLTTMPNNSSGTTTTTTTTLTNNSSGTTTAQSNNSSGTTTALTNNNSGTTTALTNNSGVAPTPSSNSISTLQSNSAATSTASITSETTTTSAGVVTTTTTTTISSTPAGIYCSTLGLCGINRIDVTNSGTITGVDSTSTSIMITALLIQTSVFSNDLETCPNGIIVGFQKSGWMQKAWCAVLINTSVISVNQTSPATVDTDKITCSSHHFMYSIQWNAGKSQRIAASCYPDISQL